MSFGGLAVLAFGGALYLLPAIIAENRRHRNSLAIWMLNIFLGWSVLGWVGALVWACTDNVRPRFTYSRDDLR